MSRVIFYSFCVDLLPDFLEVGGIFLSLLFTGPLKHFSKVGANKKYAQNVMIPRDHF